MKVEDIYSELEKLRDKNRRLKESNEILRKHNKRLRHRLAEKNDNKGAADGTIPKY